MLFLSVTQTRMQTKTRGYSRTWLIVVCFLLMPLTVQAANNTEISFLPTWKLLNAQEKQQFIAGYIRGWKDAARVTDITKEFIRANPQKALQSLESIQTLYNLSDVTPVILVSLVDAFYSDPVNRDASLSMAVSHARSRIQ